MSRLYFYKLQSEFEEDVTKNCKLSVEEIDSNFLELKKDDIKSAFVESDSIVLVRNGGDKIVIDISSIKPNTQVDYDKETGTITFTKDGAVETISGIVTKDNIDEAIRNNKNGGIFTDATLKGDGRQRRPIGISPIETTGMYSPAIKLIDLLNSSETLPSPKDAKKGDRFVTFEAINPYGLLYDFKSLKMISHDLNHDWRIPSKKDWDDMLNAIEPCDEYRKHDSMIGNHILGKYAGKLLKSNDGKWNESNTDNPFDFDGEHQYPHHDGEHHHHPQPKIIDASGTDSYGFTIVPSGYGDGGKFLGYFGDRSAFWTSTMDSVTDVYVKRFDNDKSGVVQTIENPNSLFSIRLVKDYDGHNFTGVEFINGKSYNTVLMPSMSSTTGFKIWTAENVNFTDAKYNGRNPYDSENAIEETAYFVNEWDGFRWYKKRMGEGDQIVVMEDDYDTFIIKNGEFVKNVNASSQGASKEDLDKLSEKVDVLSKDVSDNYATNSKVQTMYTDLLDKSIENKENIDNLNALVKDLSGLSSETIDELIKNQIIGGEYDNEKGVLTLLKHDSAAEPIKIEFTSDFGSMEP